MIDRGPTERAANGTPAERTKAVDAAILAIEKQFGRGSIMRLGSSERQAVDFREKPRDKARVDAGMGKRIADDAEPAGGASAAEPESPEELARRFRIVKTKRFAIEPMFEEDAVARMEELGHVFFLFVNAETERLCVLYKRNSGDYGLIEPVIAGQYTPGRSGRKAD